MIAERSTIYAPSTASGRAAVAIVRISGRELVRPSTR